MPRESLPFIQAIVNLASPWPVMPWMSTLGALFVVAIVMMVFGRGRHKGDAPHCRKCNFNLTGLPDGQGRCPECGSDLSERRARRVGSLQARPMLMRAAILLTMLVVLGGGVQSIRLVRSENFIYVKPLWWLRHDIGASNSEARENAWAEICRRSDKDGLTESQQREIVAIPAANSEYAVGSISSEIALRLRRAGKWVDREWDEFGERVSRPAVQVRPRVRRGDPIPIRIANYFSCPRSGQTESRIEVTSIRLPGVVLAKSIISEYTRSAIEGNGSEVVRESLVLSEDDWARIPDGSATIQVDVEMDLRMWLFGGPGETSYKASWRGRRTLSVPIEIVPSGIQTIEVLKDEALRQQMHEALKPVQPADWLQWSPYVESRPRSTVFQAIARDSNGHEHLLFKKAVVVKQSPDRGPSDYFELPDGKYDLILRPDPAAAAETIDCDVIWGVEEVYPNLIVMPPPPLE